MKQLFEEDLKRIEKVGLIPIIVSDNPAKVVRLGRKLLELGLDVAEITMRKEGAMDVLAKLCKDVPDLLAGAGTVFSIAVAKQAVVAGARFIVSPHLDEQLVTYCIDNNIIPCPGGFTPTEVSRAISFVSRRMSNPLDIPLLMKIFPAASGGSRHIRALKEVFPHVRFVPTGGVNATNLADYIGAGSFAVGGSWICRSDLIEKGDFDTISCLTQEALTIIEKTKSKPDKGS